MSEATSDFPPYRTLVTEGVNPAMAAHLQILHNQLESIALKQEAMLRELPRIVEEAAKSTIQTLLADDNFVDALWKNHWIHFSKHAADGSQRWLGARLFTALGVGLAGLGAWIFLRGSR